MSKSKQKGTLPALRWDLVNDIYNKLDDLLCDEVNKNKFTFVEIGAILQLMQLKVLKSEVKHLVGIALGDFSSKESDSKNGACYK